jgi:hypothetical protein
MKQSKSKWHPAIKFAIVGTIALLGAWLVTKLPRIEISVESAPPDRAPVIETQPTNSSVAKVDLAVRPTAAAGNFRISNRSTHPVRVALRARSLNDSNAKAKNPAKEFAAPAHWDFDPGEGSASGLLVTLPDRAIKLKKGDVLVAFAQDGSQRYWGPYIVGETDVPRWNPQTNEWELTLDQ